MSNPEITEGNILTVFSSSTPSVDDDLYPVPFFWYTTTTSALWYISDNTTGAAVWNKIPVDSRRQTFTPVLIGTTGAGTGTYTTQVGKYEQIGSRVMGEIELVWTAHTGTGNMQITGLPKTANSDITFICQVETESITLPVGGLVPFGKITGTQIDLLAIVTATVPSAIGMSASGTIRVEFNYSV